MRDEAVQASTGKAWAEWFAQLDADGARGFDHKTLAKHLAAAHRLNPWWCQTVAIEYEIHRGTRERGERDDGFGVDVQRTLPSSPGTVWAAWAEPAGWAGWFTSWAVFGPDADGATHLVAMASASDAYTSDRETGSDGPAAAAHATRPVPVAAAVPPAAQVPDDGGAAGLTNGRAATVGDRYLTADGDRGEFKRVQPEACLAFTWEHKKHTPSLVTVTLAPAKSGGTTVRVSHTKLRSAEEVENLRSGWTWALGALQEWLAQASPNSR